MLFLGLASGRCFPDICCPLRQVRQHLAGTETSALPFLMLPVLQCRPTSPHYSSMPCPLVFMQPEEGCLPDDISPAKNSSRNRLDRHQVRLSLHKGGDTCLKQSAAR